MTPSRGPLGTRCNQLLRSAFGHRPTFNERDNVTYAVPAAGGELKGIPFEVIFVDEQFPRRTCEVVRAWPGRHPRALHPRSPAGLSGACIEGILTSSAPWAAVIDADLQHDETQLRRCWRCCKAASSSRGRSRYIEAQPDSFDKQRAGPVSSPLNGKNACCG